MNYIFDTLSFFFSLLFCFKDVYDTPCYSTTWRGPTFVVLATLKTIDPTWKWVLAGVAMIFQEDK